MLNNSYISTHINAALCKPSFIEGWLSENCSHWSFLQDIIYMDASSGIPRLISIIHLSFGIPYFWIIESHPSFELVEELRFGTTCNIVILIIHPFYIDFMFFSKTTCFNVAGLLDVEWFSEVMTEMVHSCTWSNLLVFPTQVVLSLVHFWDTQLEHTIRTDWLF